MCVFFATSVSAEVWSQQRLTMRLGETGLKEVFKEIQRQTNKAVVYNDDQLTLSKKVKANFTDVELEEILKQVLQGQGMSYKFMDDYIILVKQPATPQHVEEVTVKGKVTDKEGMMMRGCCSCCDCCCVCDSMDDCCCCDCCCVCDSMDDCCDSNDCCCCDCCNSMDCCCDCIGCCRLPMDD